MSQTMSPIGRAVLIAREGCRLNAYLDSAGVPTIGVGHTGRASPPAVQLGQRITMAEAEAMLAADLAPFEAAVREAVTVALADHAFDALVSLAFNIGTGALKRSSVVRRLSVGDHSGAADAILLWNKPAALLGRREAERAQFLAPYDHALPMPRLGESPVGRAAAVPAPVHRASVVVRPPASTPSPRLGWLSRLWIALTFRKAA